MPDGLTNLTIPTAASSPAGAATSRLGKRRRGRMASLAALRPDHPDALVIKLAREVLANYQRMLRAQAQLPDPDAWSPMSSRCDRETLEMDRAHGEYGRLREALARVPARTKAGMQAKLIAHLSDHGVHPDCMTAADWATVDLDQPLVASVMRDVLAEKQAPDLAR
jgi:hypothetical protein